MSLHSFDPKVAEIAGLNAAVIHKNIKYWTEKNLANNKHIKDGYVWTYNSRSAFAKLFPYLTASQVKTGISKLVKSGLLIKGGYNKANYDKTNWYACSESALWLSAIGQESPMEGSGITNGLAKNDQPIPNSNTISKPNGKLITDVRGKVDVVLTAWNTMAKQHKMPMVKTNVMNAHRSATIVKRLQDCGGDLSHLIHAIRNVPNNPHWLGENNRGWRADFDWVFKTANFPKVFEFDTPAQPKAQHDRTNANTRQQQKSNAIVQSAIRASAGMGSSAGNQIPEEWASPPAGSIEGS